MKYKVHLFLLLVFLICIRLTLNGQVNADFIAPDTVCVGEAVNITNLSTGGSTYYWNFCSGNFGNDPVAQNIGNPGSTLNTPAYITCVKDGNDCFSFTTNQNLPSLSRHYHGTSFRNDPISSYNFGSFGILLYNRVEGIQIIKDNGNWYGFINNHTDLVRLNFGTSLWNTPSIESISIPGMNLGHGLVIIKEGITWVGFIDNAWGDDLLRLNFGNSLTNIPICQNLGNIANFSHPSQFQIINENNLWYMFIMNNTNNTISRISFGSSLLNNPSGINLGNIGELNQPVGITIMQDCDSTVGYFTNWVNNGSIGRLTFSGGLTGILTGTVIPYLTNYNLPHAFSEIIRESDSLIIYITIAGTSSLTRLIFPPCSNSSIPSSNLFTPPSFSYNSPGTYNISLVVNEGLPDQASACKKIVVIPGPIVNLGPDKTICLGQSITFDAGYCQGCSYVWSDITTGQANVGSGQTYTTGTAGIYSVTVKNSMGCTGKDTIQLSVTPLPAPNINGPAFACIGSTGNVYSTQPGMASYQWVVTPGGIITSGLGTNSITVSWISTGSQWVGVNYSDKNGCTAAVPSWLEVMVTLLPDTSGIVTGLTPVCAGMNGIVYSVDPIVNAINYVWTLPPGTSVVSGSGTSSITVNFGMNASSGDIIVYGNNICGNGVPSPPYPVTVHQSPLADAGRDQSITSGSSAVLSGSASGGSGSFSFHWEPASLLETNNIANPVTIALTKDTLFFLTATDLVSGCSGSDTVKIHVLNPVRPPESDCIVIHNVITPNGDGMNDTWIIDCIENFPDNSIRLFNRWGDKVNSFEHYNNTSIAWKGTNFKGDPLPDGTYYYILTIRNEGKWRGFVYIRGESE